MPVKSEAQRKFMYASLAGKTDVPPSVAKKFVGPTAHAQGGALKESEMKMSPAKQAMEMRHAAAFKKAGKPKMAAEEMNEAKGKGYAKGGKIDGCAQRGKTKGRYI